MIPFRHPSAFSLLELSIVLVIIGLLTGGVLAGKSLIRGSELQTVTTELEKYNTAVQSFKDKYQAIPGDFNRATAFWGYAGGTGCTNSSATTATTPGTCDGNGNGILIAAGAVSQTGEMFQFWRQLALAKMIEGQYTGIAGSAAVNDSTPGTNVPKSKVSSAAWSIANGQVSTTAMFDNIDYGNALYFGAALSGNLTVSPALKPEEAWNIDTKLDDGMPGTGSVSVWNSSYSTTPGSTSCTLATDHTTTTAAYNLTGTSVACALIFTHAT